MLCMNYINGLNSIVYKRSRYLYNAIELKNNDKTHLNNLSGYTYFLLNHPIIAFFCLIALLAFSHSNNFVEATAGIIDNINQSYVINPSALNSVNNNDIGQNHASCNCVVFRMDDIQDNWLNSVQNEVMDVFLNHNQKVCP